MKSIDRETNHVVRPDERRWNVRWVNAGDAADEDDEDENVVDEDFCKTKVKKLQNPKDPTKEEREEHEKTHLPFRSWCRHCVRGRGVQ